jgi:4-hydroxy-3-methylbut-2-enyl diphosphate reductase
VDNATALDAPVIVPTHRRAIGGAARRLTVLLANPRGFCAGVDRAIRVVELAIERYGAPVYVRHEIVHNRHVVERLKALGAIFVEELTDVPDGVPVVFSAHGVPKCVPAEAGARGLVAIDATCPLVSRVHKLAEKLHFAGRHILFIGHAGHPEVIGTFGQVPPGAMTLVQSAADAESVRVPPGPLAYLTQTTLSVDDTHAIVAALTRRFPAIEAPSKDDICYATSNRQEAVKAIATRADFVLVIGAPNSSNSVRLAEVAARCGAPARLVQDAGEIDWAWLDGVETLGVTAGASAPESLVDGVLSALADRYELATELVTTAEEHVTFKLPKALAG